MQRTPPLSWRRTRQRRALLAKQESPGIAVRIFVERPGTPHADVDWEGMRECVQVSMRFLDNVIDANHRPLPQVREISCGNRKIGLGIMGFADTLILLWMRYDSD